MILPDLGQLIADLIPAPQPVTVTRATGAYDDAAGNWVRDEAPEPLTLEASVQPTPPRQLEQLPENERVREAITVYAKGELYVSDVTTGREADVLTWQGRNYKVIKVAPWTETAGFSMAIATRVGV